MVTKNIVTNKSEFNQLGQKYKDNPPVCPVCGKKMIEVKDSIAKAFTGFNWRCPCMPKDLVLMFL